jgi:uncharacterized protein
MWLHAERNGPPDEEEMLMPMMLCPNCNEGMREVDRQGVHIDVCPKCRGVWLDRGELDKLLHVAREVDDDYHRERDSWAHHPQSAGGRQPYRHKKKKSFLDVLEIFG